LEEDLVTSKNTAITLENNRQETFETTIAEYNAILANLDQTQTELTNYSSEM